MNVGVFVCLKEETGGSHFLLRFLFNEKISHFQFTFFPFDN